MSGNRIVVSLQLIYFSVWHVVFCPIACECGLMALFIIRTRGYEAFGQQQLFT